MKQNFISLLVAAVIILFGARQGYSEESEVGRYQLHTYAGVVYKIDTILGQVKVLLPNGAGFYPLADYLSPSDGSELIEQLNLLREHLVKQAKTSAELYRGKKK